VRFIASFFNYPVPLFVFISWRVSGKSATVFKKIETDNISGHELAEELHTSVNKMKTGVMKNFAPQSSYGCYQILKIIILRIVAFFTLSIVHYSIEHNISEPDLFTSSGERMGGVYFVGSVRITSALNNSPKKLILFITHFCFI
jgi:hypothetical protein